MSVNKNVRLAAAANLVPASRAAAASASPAGARPRAAAINSSPASPQSQPQRPGQQYRGVLAGGTVDPALQVADRPLAHLCGLGELVLGQPGLIAQLPQQPAKTQPSLLRYWSIDRGTLPPSGRPAPALHRFRRTHDLHRPA